MWRKPSYCCNCGDRVERLEWHLWNSKRYCELCETEFVFDEWCPRAAVFLILVVGFTGIGFHLADGKTRPRLETKNLSLSSNPQGADKSGGPTAKAASPADGKQPIRLVPEAAPAAAGGQIPATGASQSGSAAAKPRKSGTAGAKMVPEVITFCGALTKKGTPCARKVKGGGRCWQHAGK